MVYKVGTFKIPKNKKKYCKILNIIEKINAIITERNISACEQKLILTGTPDFSDLRKI